MFPNTLTVSINGADVVLTKILEQNYSGEYFAKISTSGEVRLRIRHSKTKATATKMAMDRHNVEIISSSYATALTDAYDIKSYFVIEGPPRYMNSTVNAHGLFALAIASSDAFLNQLLNWES